MNNATNSGVVNQFLHQFDHFLNYGFIHISADVYWIITFITTLSIVLAALYWSLSENGDVLAPFLRKILLVGFFAWLTLNWQTLVNTVMKGFVMLGLKAGGHRITVQDFSSPGMLAHQGFVLYKKILDQIDAQFGFISTFAHLGTVIGLNLAALICLLAFFIIAIQVFITIVEFKLVTLATFILVPFGIWGKTSFLSERALGYVLSAGLKFMVMALVVSFGYAVFDQLNAGTVPNLDTAWSIALGSLVLLASAVFIPSLAMSLITGGPSLGGGSAATTGLALAGTGAASLAALGAGYSATKGGTRLGMNAMRAAAGVASGGTSTAAGAAAGTAGQIASSTGQTAGAAASNAGKAGAQGAQSAAGNTGQSTPQFGKTGASSATKNNVAANKESAGTGTSANSENTSNRPNRDSRGRVPPGSRFRQVQQAVSPFQGQDDSGGINSTGSTTEEE